MLPETFTDDADRLRRFEREAKTLASLNHPNVAGIFGVLMEVPPEERALDRQISPDGRRVAWVQGEALWVCELDDREPRALVEQRVNTFDWSCDGTDSSRCRVT